MSPNGIIDQDAIGMTDLGEGRPDAPNNTANAKVSGGNEREQIIAALERTGWVQAKAARLLNMTPRQVAYRIMTMNIRMKHI
jgi:Nif-specific regulatory protein